MGLCSFCVGTMEQQAKQAGFSLLEPPLPFQDPERTVMGIHVWFWKGQWRADPKAAV